MQLYRIGLSLLLAAGWIVFSSAQGPVQQTGPVSGVGGGGGGGGGGVTGGSCPGGQFATAVSSSGVPTCATPAGGGDALTTQPLSQFAATSCAQLAGVMSGETGTCGSLVLSSSPTLVTPALGTPSSVVLTNATGYPLSALTGAGAGVLTWGTTPSSANLAAALTNETGTNLAVFSTNPAISFAYVEKTGNYTITLADHTINAITNASTQTLPTAVGHTQSFTVENWQTVNSVTVATTGGQTIDGASSLTVVNGAVEFKSTGANWTVVSSAGPPVGSALAGSLIYFSANNVPTTNTANLKFDVTKNELQSLGTAFKGPRPWVDGMHPAFFVSGRGATTTTGTITATTATLVVADASTYEIGQGIYIVGAGTGGTATFVANILSIVGTTITLDANAISSVTDAATGHSDTVGLQAWVDYISSANVGANGGKGVLPTGKYNVCGLDIKPQVEIEGMGPGNTQIDAIPGCAALGTITMGATGTVRRIGIHDMWISGNKAAGNTHACVYVTSALTGGVTGHRFERLRIADCGGDGMDFVTSASNRLTGMWIKDVQVITTNGYGFDLSDATTDSFFTNTQSNLTGLHGYRVLGGYNTFTGTAADDAGQVDSTTSGDGYFFSGTAALANRGTGMRAANNLRDGIQFDGANVGNNIDISIIASNFAARDAVRVTGGTYNTVRASVKGPNDFTSIVNFVGGSDNRITVSYDPAALAAGTAAIQGSAIAANRLSQNGSTPTLWVIGNGATGDEVTAAESAGTAIAFASTITLPADFFSHSGKAVLVMAEFEITTPGSGVPALQLRLRSGATVLAASTSTAPSVSLTNRGFGVQWKITSLAGPGASVNLETAWLSPNWFISIPSAGNTTAQPVAVATNAAIVLTLDCGWASNVANTDLQLRKIDVLPIN